MKTVLLPFLGFFCVKTFAQNLAPTTSPAFLSGLVMYDLTRSYGFSFAGSVPFHCTIHQKKSEARTRQTNDLISAEIGSEHSPGTYTNIFASAGVGIRFVKSMAHYTEISITQGILRTIYDGNVYVVQQDGSVKQRALFGRTYARTALSYSQFWSISRQNIFFIELRPSSWLQYPYNSFLKVHVSLQVGASYFFRNIPLHQRTKSR